MISVDFQGSAVFPHILALSFNRKARDREKNTGISQLLFLSLAFVSQIRHDMNDFICQLESIFCVNKYVALVSFAGRKILNVSGGEQMQNKLYFHGDLVKLFTL